jgi:hypothetical protein
MFAIGTAKLDLTCLFVERLLDRLLQATHIVYAREAYSARLAACSNLPLSTRREPAGGMTAGRQSEEQR